MQCVFSFSLLHFLKFDFANVFEPHKYQPVLIGTFLSVVNRFLNLIPNTVRPSITAGRVHHNLKV